MILCDLPYHITAAKWDRDLNMDKLWEEYNRVTGFLYSKTAPMHQYEEILVFSQTSFAKTRNPEECMNYFPQGLRLINKRVDKRNNNFTSIHKYNPSNVRYASKPQIQKYTNYPKDVLEFPVETHQVYPTQKPVALLEYLIKTYTKEGDLVLDNTMGSGSTMVATINTNRRGIGMEIDDKPFEIATKRVEEALKLKEQNKESREIK